MTFKHPNIVNLPSSNCCIFFLNHLLSHWLKFVIASKFTQNLILIQSCFHLEWWNIFVDFFNLWSVAVGNIVTLGKLIYTIQELKWVLGTWYKLAMWMRISAEIWQLWLCVIQGVDDVTYCTGLSRWCRSCVKSCKTISLASKTINPYFYIVIYLLLTNNTFRRHKYIII